jgi:hypothetical protein
MLGQGSENGWIGFGGLPDSEKADDFVSHRIAGSFHWQLKMNKVAIGSTEIQTEVPLGLTDTGTTISYFTPGDYHKVMNAICPDCMFEQAFGYYIIHCNETIQANFEPLLIYIDSYEYRIPVKNYLHLYFRFGVPVC